MTRKWQHLISRILFWASGCVLRGLTRKRQFVIWKMAPLAATGPTAWAAASSSEKEERHLLRHGVRSPCFHPRRDPAWRCCHRSEDLVQGQAFSAPCALLRALQISNRHYITALGWINRLSYPFYDPVKCEKINILQCVTPPTSFPCNKCFQSFKLSSHLLKAYHLQWLMPWSNYPDSEAREKNEPSYNWAVNKTEKTKYTENCTIIMSLYPLFWRGETFLEDNVLYPP